MTTPKPPPRKRVWRLIAYNVHPAQAGLMARLKMIPGKDYPTTFWRDYPRSELGRKQILAARDLLIAAGLRGKTKPAEVTTKSRRFKAGVRAVSREGFGGNLNAQPIASSWRRRLRRK